MTGPSYPRVFKRLSRIGGYFYALIDKPGEQAPAIHDRGHVSSGDWSEESLVFGDTRMRGDRHDWREVTHEPEIQAALRQLDEAAT